MSNNLEKQQYTIQGYSLSKLLKRLEDATARLEDLTFYQENYLLEKYNVSIEGVNNVPSASQDTADPSVIKTIGAQQDLQNIDVKEETITEQVEKPLAIKEFDLFIEDNIKPLFEVSEKIDTVVKDAAKLYLEAYIETSKFLQACALASKPDMQSAEFAEALKPISTKIMEINEFKESQRNSKYSAYLSSFCEGFPVFSWVTTTTPQGLVDSFKEAAQFWTNRVLKEFREADPNSVEWVKLYLSGFDELKKYIKQYQTTGPTFKSSGGIPLTEALKNISSDVSSSFSSTSSSSLTVPTSGGSTGGAPPPPPPPPPAAVFEVKTESKPTKSVDSGDMTAVFAQLSQGEAITSGLKKVDKSEIKKNPLPASSTANTASKNSGPPIKPKKPQDISMKQPKKEMVGNKWFVMDFVNEPQPIVIEGSSLDESVFVGKCINTVVQVKGKINSITFNECQGSSLVMDSCVAGVDFIKCNKFGLQVDGTCPMISIDKCEGGDIYLSKDSINADISTSCATALNVNLPIGEDDEYVEFPIAEQLIHKFDVTKGKNGKIVSQVFEHAG
ncbi:hypothetical protein ACO0SA_001537 [Hanseniaspora valbyensis]